MFTLSPLPFKPTALEPHISAKTLEFHYGKHHQAYVDNLNKLVAGTDLETATLEEIIMKTAGSLDKASIFNNAAQVYNHDFFWKSLRPADASLEPSADLLSAINTSFGSLDSFYNEFKTAALGQFGSGWAWLSVTPDGEMVIETTPNQDNPMMNGGQPLLGLDVWEHAYYLKNQNRRADYVDAWWYVVNWDYVAERYAEAKKE